MGDHRLLPPARDTGGRRWTPLQKLFVAEYLVDLCATRAYIRAGGAKKSADSKGPRMLRVPHVRAAVDAELADRKARIRDRAVRVIEETYRQAVADVGELLDADGNPLPVHKMPADIRRALVSVKVEYREQRVQADDGETIRRVPVVAEYKLHDKRASQETFLKWAGELKDKVEVEGKLTLEDLVLAADRKIREQQAAAKK